MDACERCGVEGYKEHTEQTKLAGGYMVNICNRCSNEWGEHVSATPEWAALQEVGVDLDCIHIKALAGFAPDDERLGDLLRRQHALQRELYDIGKEFVATGVKVAVED